MWVRDTAAQVAEDATAILKIRKNAHTGTQNNLLLGGLTKQSLVGTSM